MNVEMLSLAGLLLTLGGILICAFRGFGTAVYGLFLVGSLLLTVAMWQKEVRLLSALLIAWALVNVYMLYRRPPCAWIRRPARISMRVRR